MLETVAKNLWLLLTLVIPGLFTYGAWRMLLLLDPSARLDAEALKQIDGSALTTTSIIIAIALLQQSIAIALESLLAVVGKTKKKEWPSYYSLFCERFALAAAGKLDENATRIIGNFFLSLNMSVGLAILLLYFVAYEYCASDWVIMGLAGLLVIALITSIFRMFDAMWAIKECKKSHH